MTESAGAGSAWGQWALGRFYHTLRRFDEAARFYRMAAEQGRSQARPSLGQMFEHGHRMNRAVLAEVVYYFRTAAERGHSDAQIYLGCLIQHGCGVPQDSAGAECFYRMAANPSNADGLFRLGLVYEHGK